MKKFWILLLCSTVVGCSTSYSDAVSAIQGLNYICDGNSFRVTRTADGEKEVVTVTCIRKTVK